MTLRDKLGQTTELEFSRIERNPRFDADTFTFVPPPDVDVVGRATPGGG
jgi:outer membrane lipoprotein carrier protein